MRPADAPESGRRLAALLRARKDDLLQAWMRRVLSDPRVPEACRLSEPELHDHIPEIIDDLVRVLEAAEQGETSGRDLGASETARGHARNRLDKGYSLSAALREFSQFRAALLELCAAEGYPLEGKAAELVHWVLDENMVTGADEMERAALEEHRRRAAIGERFIGVLGHDLRAPLATIALAVGALLKREDTTEAQARLLRRISTSEERMARMVHDLLDLSRVRVAGGIPLVPRKADLHALCQEVVEEQEIAHTGRKILLDASGPIEGTWDPDRLAQVLVNLISNALDYGPPDVPVHVTLRERGTDAMLSVNNLGPTIPPDVMPSLFDPFVQGPQTGRAVKRRSLGLGLFIVKQIVLAHGGSVDVESTPERGTTFTVRLPRGGSEGA